MGERPYEGYIGVFDSGVGGISVLKSLTALLPEERFLYFGDSANAPYGEKTVREIQDLTMAIVDHMVEDGVKAIVIACNTATSAAAQIVRAKYRERLPIIGVEPAIKPAAKAGKHMRVLVMATPNTIRLDKFRRLLHSLKDRAEYYSVGCAGLAARIEQGNLDAPDLVELLESLIGAYRGNVDEVVLGCTHYPFIKERIRQVIGDLPMFDGADGTARELKRQLAERKLLAGDGSLGEIVFMSSKKTEEEIQLYRWFYHQKI